MRPWQKGDGVVFIPMIIIALAILGFAFFLGVTQ